MNDTQEAVTEDLEQIESSEPQVQTIKTDNPSKEEMAALTEGITADYDFEVDTRAVNFNFKKSTDKDTGIITERAQVQLAIPYSTVQGLVNIIEGKHLEEGQPNKGLELLLDVMADTVNAAARDLLSEDTSLNAGSFPVDKVSWEFIANIPKITRRGGGIPKEIWEGFAKDYVACMQEATGKTLDQVGAAAKILMNKLSAVRTNEPVLKLLQGQLAIYVSTSENAGDFTECVEFLEQKAETFLNVSDEELLANL